MCTCPLGRTRRACARVRAHGALELRHIAHICVMQIVRARGANPIGRSQGGGGLPKPPFLGVSGATNAACCAHARPCASIRIASIYISLPIAAISCPIGRATWHACTIRRQGQFLKRAGVQRHRFAENWRLSGRKWCFHTCTTHRFKRKHTPGLPWPQMVKSP